MDKETNALEEIRKELEEAKNALTIRTSKLNAVEVTMNEMKLEYENKNKVLEAAVVQHQEVSMAREKDLRALSLSLESARDELNERFNELQETRTAQDLTATKRLEEVELLKVELLRMHTDRRKALNELTRNQEHVKKHLNKLQEASRAIEKEKEQLVLHVNQTEQDTKLTESNLNNRKSILDKKVEEYELQTNQTNLTLQKEKKKLKVREMKLEKEKEKVDTLMKRVTKISKESQIKTEEAALIAGREKAILALEKSFETSREAWELEQARRDAHLKREHERIQEMQCTLEKELVEKNKNLLLREQKISKKENDLILEHQEANKSLKDVQHSAMTLKESRDLFETEMKDRRFLLDQEMERRATTMIENNVRIEKEIEKEKQHFAKTIAIERKKIEDETNEIAEHNKQLLLKQEKLKQEKSINNKEFCEIRDTLHEQALALDKKDRILQKERRAAEETKKEAERQIEQVKR